MSNQAYREQGSIPIDELRREIDSKDEEIARLRKKLKSRATLSGVSSWAWRQSKRPFRFVWKNFHYFLVASLIPGMLVGLFALIEYDRLADEEQVRIKGMVRDTAKNYMPGSPAVECMFPNKTITKDTFVHCKISTVWFSCSYEECFPLKVDP